MADDGGDVVTDRGEGADSGTAVPGVPLTALVGRARERAALDEALGRRRLVTLAGPGGVGKTRLAREAARDRPARWPEGVRWVDLSPVAAPGGVAAEAARALAVTAPPGDPPAAALARALADRRMLLVLDGCEHVVDGAARLVAALLPACPGVRVLATSREPLGVEGEAVHRLEPLPPADAARLFAERARLRDPGFLPAGPDEDLVRRLCERLDRLPLAIELAAARVGVLTPAEILERLGSGGGVLGGGSRLAPGRHRTLRATVDWSLALLGEGDRAALAALSVFAGTFDAAAALAVAGTEDLDVLARLVDRSLVQATPVAGGRTRYRLLEAVRERAAELLLESGELDAARLRHLRHLEALAARALDDWIRTGDQRGVNALDDDVDNVRAAVERAVALDPCAGLRLLAGLRDLFFRFAQEDGLRLARLLLERCPEGGRDRAAGLVAAGQLAALRMEPEAARAHLEEAVTLGERVGEPGIVAWAHFFAGLSRLFLGRGEEAHDRFLAAREGHRATGNRFGETRAAVGLCAVAATSGDLLAARRRGEEARALGAASGDGWGQGAAHTWLGLIAEQSGDPAGATRHLRRAVELLTPSRDTTLLPMALCGQAAVLAASDPARAIRVAAAATALRERVGGRFPPHVVDRVERVRRRAEGVVGARVADLWREGARLPVAEAAALAFGGGGGGGGTPRPASVAAAGDAGLSAREREVAELVAAGLANRAIAARLHLSVRTVESHVRSALRKTGAGNRTQLATWARGRAH